MKASAKQFASSAGEFAGSFVFMPVLQYFPIPDGRTASEQDMCEAKAKIQTYVREAEARLRTVDDQMLYDYIVDHLHAVADSFNFELQIFRRRRNG